MTEIVDALTKLGVTGPAALFAIAAGWMVWTYVRGYQRQVESNVEMATALSDLKLLIKMVQEDIRRLADRERNQ